MYSRFRAEKPRMWGNARHRASASGLGLGRMTRENPTWGAPRVHAELCKLGFGVSERTVSRYLAKREPLGGTKARAEQWRRFLKLHASGLRAMDMLTVPTAWFRVLYVGFVIEHESRRVVGYGVTSNPSVEHVHTSPRSPWQNGIAERGMPT